MPWKKNKNAFIFEMANDVPPRLRLFPFSCKKTKQLEGVLNPHNIEWPKIANRNPGHINMVRGVQCLRLIQAVSTMCILRSNFTVCEKP